MRSYGALQRANNRFETYISTTEQQHYQIKHTYILYSWIFTVLLALTPCVRNTSIFTGFPPASTYPHRTVHIQDTNKTAVKGLVQRHPQQFKGDPKKFLRLSSQIKSILLWNPKEGSSLAVSISAASSALETGLKEARPRWILPQHKPKQASGWFQAHFLFQSTQPLSLLWSFCQTSTKTNCFQKCRKAEIQTQIQLKSPLFYDLNYAIIWEKEGLISFQGPFKFSIPTQDKWFTCARCILCIQLGR